ncbi:MAG: hypothetical protein ACFFER_14245 [Candidatus Thorarchaeota archaeon]
MSDGHADHHLGELTEGQGPIGWSEIRNAPESIEMIRATGLEDARLLLVENCSAISLRVTLQSMDELRDYLESSLRETILGDVDSGEVVGYIRV